MSEVVFTTTKSNGDNRKLEKDDNGYYKVTLGALNVFNSANQYYTLTDDVKKLFTEDSSVLMRRIKSGALKSEVGHPKLLPGMTKNEYYARNLRIEETNICAHIRDIMLEETNIDSGYGNGDKVVLITGWIAPSGVHGEALKKDLENPDVNVAFSIRSFTQNKMIAGTLVKKLRQVVTWDWVNEPGVSYATKWKTLGIESNDKFTMSIEELKGDEENINECLNCSLESNDEKALTKEIIHTLEMETKKHIILDW